MINITLINITLIDITMTNIAMINFVMINLTMINLTMINITMINFVMTALPQMEERSQQVGAQREEMKTITELVGKLEQVPIFVCFVLSNFSFGVFIFLRRQWKSSWTRIPFAFCRLFFILFTSYIFVVLLIFYSVDQVEQAEAALKERVRLLEEEREEMRSKVNFVFFLLIIVIIIVLTIITIVIITTSIIIAIVITSPSSMLSSKVNFVFVLLIDIITIVIIIITIIIIAIVINTTIINRVTMLRSKVDCVLFF